MDDPQFLHQPLLPSAAGPVSGDVGTTWSIIFRLLSVLLVGLVSIFANHEASKGFHLTIINAAGDTPSGRRFDLFFVSNDKISRLVLDANDFVRTILSHKQDGDTDSIHSVTVHFTGEKLVAVRSDEDGHEFVINISSSVLEERDADLVMARVVARAMTMIWLWNIKIGHDKNLSCLIDSIVESIAMFSGIHSGDTDMLSSPECSEDVRKVARRLHYCEGREKGFIGRLVRVLSDTVEDPTVGGDDEMGLKRVEHLWGWCNATDLSLSNYWQVGEFY